MIIQQKSAFVNKKSRNQQKMLDDCADRTYNSPRSTKIEHQTEGGNTMAKAKRYTAEQLSDAEKMAATLANVPEEKRTLVIMMTTREHSGGTAPVLAKIPGRRKSGRQRLRTAGRNGGSETMRPDGRDHQTGRTGRRMDQSGNAG